MGDDDGAAPRRTWDADLEEGDAEYDPRRPNNYELSVERARHERDKQEAQRAVAAQVRDQEAKRLRLECASRSQALRATPGGEGGAGRGRSLVMPAWMQQRRLAEEFRPPVDQPQEYVVVVEQPAPGQGRAIFDVKAALQGLRPASTREFEADGKIVLRLAFKTVEQANACKSAVDVGSAVLGCGDKVNAFHEDS